MSQSMSVKSEPMEPMSSKFVPQDTFHSEMVVADKDTPYYEECEEDRFNDYSAGPYSGHPNVSGKSIVHFHYMLFKYQYPDHTFGDPSELLQFVRRDTLDYKFYCTIYEKFSHKVMPITRNPVESQHLPNTFNSIIHV